MIDRGHIAIADLNLEVRVAVLVLSNRRFHQLTGRVLVAPQDEPEPFPWRIDHDGRSFAIDLARTVAINNLGESLGTVSGTSQNMAARALQFIST